jgi:adenine-specific DNA-methyltransferase
MELESNNAYADSVGVRFTWRDRDQYYVGDAADSMIHKCLKAVLLRELDGSIGREFSSLGNQADSSPPLMVALSRSRITRDLCSGIIDRLAQVEELHKALFEKKRLVLRTEYCLTIDWIPEQMWDEVLGNASQIEEWRRLYMLEDLLSEGITLHRDFLRRNGSLVVDTRHFPEDFKNRLLNSLDGLDEHIDGVVVKSENLQALNTLLEKHRGCVKCIYIDPPYNTRSKSFVYKDRYEPSHWLSMMADRLSSARQWLAEDGLIFVSIDDNQLFHLKFLMDLVFGPENRVSMICHQHRKSVSNDLIISPNHNAILLYAKNEQSVFEKRFAFRLPIDDAAAVDFKNDDGDGRGPYKWVPTDGPGGARKGNPYYEFMSVAGYFRYSKETMQRLYDKGELKVTGGNIQRKHYLRDARGRAVSTWWDDVGTTTDGTRTLKALFGQGVYTNPKPVSLVERILLLSTSTDDTVLDFFAGSGTTAHATIEQNRRDGGQRKYILVEKDSSLEEVLLPRIKKVVFTGQWKDGRPVRSPDEPQIRHVVKVLYLEGFDDSINNLVFSDDARPGEPLPRAAIRYLPVSESDKASCRMSPDAVFDPFACTVRVGTGGRVVDQTVDLVETLSLLLGITVKKVLDSVYDSRRYRALAGEKNESIVVVVWRPLTGLERDSMAAHRDRSVIEDSIIPSMLGDGVLPGRLLVNGFCEIETAEGLERILDDLLFGRS